MILKNFDDYLNKLCHEISCSHRQPNHAQKPQQHYKCNKILRKKSQVSLIIARKKINKGSNYTTSKILRKFVDRKKEVGISNGDLIYVKSHINQPIFAFFLFLD